MRISALALIPIVAVLIGGMAVRAQRPVDPTRPTLGEPLPSAQPPADPSLKGFTPLEDLAGVEQIPAAPLVLAAYGFVWVAVLFYVWLTWRRLGKVEAELQQLARKTRGASP